MPRKHSPKQQALYEQEQKMIVTKTEKVQHNGYTSYHVVEKNPWSDKQDPQILKQGEEDNA